MRSSRLASMLISTALMLSGATGFAQQPADFYKAHAVTLHIGYGAGGGYDLYSRILAAHLGNHIPGNPKVVPLNEPGAGSLRLANELANDLPKDGSAIGMIGEILVTDQVLGDPAAKFKASEFNWIGRIADSDPVLVLRPQTGIATIQDALEKRSVIGIPGAGSATGLMLTVLNKVLGTRFELVSGYDGSAQIKLALERGEVDGTSSTLWRVDKDWIIRDKFNVLYQTAQESASDLAHVPMLEDLGRTQDERRLLSFFSSYTKIGRSILAPPGIPRDRRDALRKAFDDTMTDPAFISEMQSAHFDVEPLSGTQLERLIDSATTLDPPLLERAIALRRADSAK